MSVLRAGLCVVCLMVLSGCSGGGGGAGSIFNANSSNPSERVVPASQVETAKLQESIKAEPAYKIDDSEITLLQNEGILTETDLVQLQAIQ